MPSRLVPSHLKVTLLDRWGGLHSAGIGQSWEGQSLRGQSIKPKTRFLQSTPHPPQLRSWPRWPRVAQGPVQGGSRPGAPTGLN